VADFHQNGNITTLHNLRTRSSAELADELASFAQTRKISLILPCLYSELEGEAMPHILSELSKVPYLHRIIIGLDRANADQFRHAKQFFKGLNQNHIVIWNDSPRMLELGARLEAMGLAPAEQGKGKNVWSALGYLIACADQPQLSLSGCQGVLPPYRQ
jgi:glucosyl-3-phosphoglycerate synthase